MSLCQTSKIARQTFSKSRSHTNRHWRIQRLTGVLIPSMKLEAASLPGQGDLKRGEKEAKDKLDGSKSNEGIFRRFARACSHSGGSRNVKKRSSQALWGVRSIDQAISQTAA